jgi:polyphosphate kinase
MVRNLDHRVEAACPVTNTQLKNELIQLLKIQIKDDVKARILDTNFHNNYVTSRGTKKVRSQQEIYQYLSRK